MNFESRQNCQNHIDALTKTILTCPNKERAKEAEKSLFMMALLFASPDHPDFPGNMVKEIEKAITMIAADFIASELKN